MVAIGLHSLLILRQGIHSQKVLIGLVKEEVVQGPVKEKLLEMHKPKELLVVLSVANSIKLLKG